MAKYRTCKSAFDFTADLERAAQVLGVESAREAAVSVALELHSNVTGRTPRKTGRASANWFLAEGAPRLDTTTATTPEPPPALKGESIIYLTNSLPYIVPLEYGHSQQAPHGMLRIAIAEVQATIAVGRPA